MTVEEAVRLRILSLAAVLALVSTRVYLLKLPQSPTYPCVRVTLVSGQTSYHNRGENSLKAARVQVDALAKEFSGVDPYALAALVAAEMHGDGAGSGLSGWQGTIGSPLFAVDAIFRIDLPRPYYDPEELRIVTVSQDYQVLFRA